MVSTHASVSSSRRKSRKRHFQAPSHKRRIIMSAPLSKELREKHSVRSMPVRIGDEVVVKRGGFKNREGRIIKCYRRRFVIHVDKVTRDKVNGQSVPVPIHPSKVQITKLHMTGDRTKILQRKARAKLEAKGKISSSEVAKS